MKAPDGHANGWHRAWLVVVVMLLAGSTTPLEAEPPSNPLFTGNAATELPPLPSTSAPVAQPSEDAADFSDGPGTASARRTASFDPAGSRVLDDQTTPTRRSFSNPDGTRTDVLSALPTRFRDGDGRWRDIDRRLKAGPGDDLEATAGPSSAPRLPGRATGAARLNTPAGPVLVRHPEASAVVGLVTDDVARYPKALPGAAELQVRLIGEGFEESVVLPDAKAPRRIWPIWSCRPVSRPAPARRRWNWLAPRERSSLVSVTAWLSTVLCHAPKRPFRWRWYRPPASW